MTTDKATVEIPASAGGRVTWLGGEPGETMAIGGDLIRIDTDDAAADDVGREAKAPEEPDAVHSPEPVESPPAPQPAPSRAPQSTAPSMLGARDATGNPLAAPSVRGRAREAGVDLRRVRGTGPAGRILHSDLEDFIAHGAAMQGTGPEPRTATTEIPVTGVRRAIAERMADAKRHIPHFSIIEEVEVEALEELRGRLNDRFGADRGKLTLLPFIIRAVSEAILDHPEINAHFDDEAGIVTRYEALHAGIATQTYQGLMVPVIEHAEALSLWETAAELRRLSDAARARRAGPKELTGSTLSITSLGPLGAIATTPIINRPEVAIVGINKMSVRPVWNGGKFVPRRMMNLSCSFDHRVVDGWVAAEFVAKLKSLLEVPAMLFMEYRDE